MESPAGNTEDVGSFLTVFRMSHINLRLTSDPTVEDLGIPHVNMVRDVVAGLQEALQLEQTQTETLTSVQAPVDHADNVVQSTQQQLAM